MTKSKQLNFQIDEEYKETTNKLANLVRQYSNLTANQKKTAHDLVKISKDLAEEQS